MRDAKGAWRSCSQIYWACIGLLLACSTQAHAQNTEPTRVFKNVEAAPIYRNLFSAEAGSTVLIQTVGTTNGAVPVLRLWDAQLKKEIASNALGGVGNNAKISVTLSTSGTFAIIMHAQSALAVGANDTTNIYLNGSNIGPNVPVVNAQINGEWKEPNSFSTAHSPTGCTSSQIYLIACDGTLRNWGHFNGPGSTATASASDICQILVGGVGTVNVYVNDGLISVGETSISLNDGDKDGLGQKLEAQLGTCDPNNENVPGAWPHYCRWIKNHKDTDRDGLNDYEEILGNGRLLLPRWGADPLQKDIFVFIMYEEGDYNNNENPIFTDAEYRKNFATKLREIFSAGTSTTLGNPNGKDGVRIHFHAGAYPTDPNAILAKEGVFGDWEKDLYGSWAKDAIFSKEQLQTLCQQSPASQTSHCKEFITCAAAGKTCHTESRVVLYLEYIPEEWRHRIHLGLAYDGSGGNAPILGKTMTFGVKASDITKSISNLAHELGHNIGLQHYGHSSWGAVQCKPHYQSLMNYAYTTGFIQENGSKKMQFSRGTYERIALNPSRVVEAQSFKGINPPKSLLTSAFKYPIIDAQIDWNVDEIKQTTSFRTPLTGTASVVGCAAFSQEAQLLETPLLEISPNKYKGSPQLARADKHLYAFYIEGQKLRYKRTEIQGNSCVNDGKQAWERCHWSHSNTIPIASNADHFSIVPYQQRWVLAYSKNDQIYTAHTLSPSDAIHDANIWSTVSKLSFSTAKTNKGLQLQTMPAARPYNKAILWLSWVESSTGIVRWSRKQHATDAWSSHGTYKNSKAQPIFSTQLPAFSRYGCMLTIDERNLFQFYCNNGAHWRNLQSSFQGVYKKSFASPHPPSITFRPLRNGADTNSPNSAYKPHKGQFWIAQREKKTLMYTSNVLQLGDPNTFLTDKLMDSIVLTRADAVGSQWNNNMANTSVSLFDDGTAAIGGIKGLWIHHKDETLRLEFLPFADGTYNKTLKDGNDFKIMEVGICLSLHSNDQEYCGHKNPAGKVVGLWNIHPE